MSRLILVTIPDNGPVAFLMITGRVKKFSDMGDTRTLIVTSVLTLITAKVLELLRSNVASGLDKFSHGKFSWLSAIVGPRDFYQFNEKQGKLNE